MMAKPRRCALPGCDAVIKPNPGRVGLRYCCNEHRLAAQRARRKKARSAHRQAPPGRATPPEGNAPARPGDEPTIPIRRDPVAPSEPVAGCSVPRRQVRYRPASYEPGPAPWDIPPPRSRAGPGRGHRVTRWAVAGALVVVAATAWVIGRCAGDGAVEQQPQRHSLGASPALSPVSGALLTHHRVSVTFERATAGSAVADVDPAERTHDFAPVS